MHHRERLFIYASLLVLGGLQISTLLNSVGRTAVASQPLARTMDDLGPAERLILAGAQADSPELALFNREGRPAWGEKPTHGAYSFALVNVDPLINGIMRTDAYTEDRERLLEEVQQRDEELLAERETLQNQLRDLTPDDPQFERIMEEASALYQQHMEFRRESSFRRGEMEAEQLERAFREMTTGIEIIADRLDLDIVYPFTPVEKDFTAGNRAQANEEIRMRTVLRYPDGLDITADVRQVLALPVE